MYLMWHGEAERHSLNMLEEMHKGKPQVQNVGTINCTQFVQRMHDELQYWFQRNNENPCWEL